MAERSIILRLRAEVADFQRRMREAGKSTADVKDAADKAGQALTAFGAVGVGALGLSAKAAIEWESAWAGVTKTVDGSKAEMAELEGGLRSLARTLPSTHGEIAAVAEAAGQLGVKRADIVGFTKTMIDLGETTNLSADEAATSIAQLMNVMQTAPKDVGRLGATLVALGNDGASTEKQIIEMAQRISGAAAVVGLSEGEVLAFANTVASMGIEVEAGGSSVARVLTTMSKAAANGGAELEVFAETAGMSAEEFARAFKEGPADATATFIEGLGGIQEAGGNVFGVLDELGLSDIRVSQALLSMSANSGQLRKDLELQATAWQDNTALLEEAEKRYGTTAAQIAITKNNITDAAISFGDVLLPAIRDASGGVRDFAGWLTELDENQQRAIVSTTAVTSGTALAAGAFLLTAPRVMDTYRAFQLLARVNPTAAAGLMSVGKAAGIATVAIIGANIAYNLLNENDQVVSSTEDMTRALASQAITVADLDEQVRGLAESGSMTGSINGFGSMREALENLTAPSLMDRLDDFGAELISLGAADGRIERDRLVEQLNSTGEALATLALSGNIEGAAAQFAVYKAEAHAAGMTTEELLNLVPALRDVYEQLEAQEALNVESARASAAAIGGVGDTAGMTTAEIEEAVAAMEEWRTEVADVYASFVEPMSTYTTLLAAKQEAEQATAQATADATESQSDSWEDFAGTVSVSVDEYLTDIDRQVQAQADWATNMLILSSRVSEGTLAELARLGPEGAPLIADLKDASDEELAQMEAGFEARSRNSVDNMARILTEAGPVLSRIAAIAGQGTVEALTEQLVAGTTSIAQIAADYGIKLAGGINPILTSLGKQRISVGGSGGVTEFAGGGFHEDHVAQIAPGGAYRLWAEDETAGETHLPLRRPRTPHPQEVPA